ncbi:MAG: preprotein translocase subunit SecG [Thermoanaerobaculia bacterium]
MLVLLTIIHIVVCLFLILVVLLQQGKGADLSVFGGGGTQAAFGARGATTLLHKLTVGSFVAFIFTTMAIGFIRTGGSDPVLQGLPGAPSPIQEPADEQEQIPMDDGAAAETPAAPEQNAPAGEPTEETTDGADEGEGQTADEPGGASN